MHNEAITNAAGGYRKLRPHPGKSMVGLALTYLAFLYSRPSKLKWSHWWGVLYSPSPPLLFLVSNLSRVTFSHHANLRARMTGDRHTEPHATSLLRLLSRFTGSKRSLCSGCAVNIRSSGSYNTLAIEADRTRLFPSRFTVLYSP